MNLKYYLKYWKWNCENGSEENALDEIHIVSLKPLLHKTQKTII